MDTLRNIDTYEIDDSKPLVMQCLHWNSDNEFVEDEESSTDKRTLFNFEHIVKIYGVDEEGHSVSLRVNKFQPYFYIKVPIDADKSLKMKVIQELKESGRIKPFEASLWGLTAGTLGTGLLFTTAGLPTAVLGAGNIALYAGM